MAAFLPWYLVVTALGISAFPLAARLLPGLADRGYSFSRILGLLVWGYLYWILGYLGLLRNGGGSLLFAFLAVAALGVLALRGPHREELAGWLRTNLRVVVTVEALFLAAFWAWTVIRGMNPEITATEKPMELAFLNSILRSPGFPPNDPWLSGYAISYYYFGFILVGMLAMATGTAAGVAFNLGIAVVFALGALGAYGVVYNLLARSERSGGSFLLALFGPLYVLLVSNWEGFLELLHANGLFWSRDESGEMVSRFWSWLDLKDLVNPPADPVTGLPERFLWWWRASRVVNDVGFAGGQQEVIDEFPFFSFLLADLHPHVMAIPFVLLAIGLAWSVFIRPDGERLRIRGFDLGLSAGEISVAALLTGALAFLNTWDFPIYVGLFTAVLVFKLASTEGWSTGTVARGLATGLAIGLLGVALYFPFYIGFSSQAGGILPNVLNPTRGAHLWVMFGPLFVPVLLYLGGLVSQREFDWKRGLLWGFGIVVGLFLLSALISGVIALVPEARTEALSRLGAPDLQALVRESLSRRFSSFGGWLTLGVLLSAIAGFLLRPDGRQPVTFTVLMLGIAALLVVGPEFFYLRDLFGTRMNTIFKFYYQAWILFALAAAFATARVLTGWRGLPAAAGGLVLAASLFAGLVYPVLSLQTRTDGYSPEAGLNLDGTTHGAYLNDDDRAAVAWLQEAPLGVLVEAVGGSYSSGARISTHSGQPAVIGWVFHEGQWRGGYEEVGSREGDVEKIYASRSWAETADLLNRYGVTYVYLGSLEQTTYDVDLAKFERNLPVVFRQGRVTIYGYTPAAAP